MVVSLVFAAGQRVAQAAHVRQIDALLAGGRGVDAHIVRVGIDDVVGIGVDVRARDVRRLAQQRRFRLAADSGIDRRAVFKAHAHLAGFAPAGQDQRAVIARPVFFCGVPRLFGEEAAHAVIVRIDQRDVLAHENVPWQTHAAHFEQKLSQERAGIAVGKHGELRRLPAFSGERRAVVNGLGLDDEVHERLIAVPAAPHIEPPHRQSAGQHAPEGLRHLGERAFDGLGAFPDGIVERELRVRVYEGRAVVHLLRMAGADVGLHEPDLIVQQRRIHRAGQREIAAQRPRVVIAEGAGEEVDRRRSEHDVRGVMPHVDGAGRVAVKRADDLPAAAHALAGLAQPHDGHGGLHMIEAVEIARAGRVRLIAALGGRGGLNVLKGGVVRAPCGVQALNVALIALGKPAAVGALRRLGIVDVVIVVRMDAQKLLRAARGQMPARDVSVPAGFGQPVLKARHDALCVGKPLFR